MRAAQLAWVFLIASGTAGCLLFTDEVNAPPEVRIDGPGQLRRGERAKFSAEVVDATGGSPKYDWHAGRDCPVDLAGAANTGEHLETAPTQIGVQPDPGPYCLWVVVTDAEGARGFAVKKVDVKDRNLVVTPPPELQSGQPGVFTAAYSDDPAATPLSSFSWALARDLRCEDAELATGVNPVEPGLFSFRYERVQRAPFCVAVLARDEFDVERRAKLPVTDIRIAAPPARIRLVPRGLPRITMKDPTIYGIFSDIRLAAADEGELNPDESLRFAWKLTGPDGVATAPALCPDARPTGSEVCFQPALRGTYRVDLTVSDDENRSTTSPTLPLQVEDGPPCIRNSEPRFSSAPKFFDFYDRERVLKVTEVQDDGDPWPAPGRPSQRAFRWSIRKHVPDMMMARFERRVSAVFDSFTIPAREYQPRDRIDVRVEYFDRRDLEDPQARGVSSRCRPEDRVCELSPGCFQWITWTVEYL
jgi:hypothetical protein